MSLYQTLLILIIVCVAFHTNGVLNQLIAGGPGSCLTFFRTSDYVQFSNLEKVNSTELTIELWLKSNSFSELFTPFSYAIWNNPRSLAWIGRSSLHWLDATISFVDQQLNNNSNLNVMFNSSHPGLSTLYEWHHYAFTWSSFTGELQFFIDGWQWMNVTLPNTIGQTLPAGGILVLGNLQGTPGGNFDVQYSFQGYIDEVKIWGRRLSASEIISQMHQTRDPNTTVGLISYWTFNDQNNFGVTDLMGLNNGTFGYWNGQTYSLGVTSNTVINGISSAPVVGSGVPTLISLDPNSQVVIPLFYILDGQFRQGNVSIFGSVLPNNGNLFKYLSNGTKGDMIVNNLTDMGNPVVYEPISLLFNQYLSDQFTYTVRSGLYQSTGTVYIYAKTAPVSNPQNILVLNGQSTLIGLQCINNAGDPTDAIIKSLPSIGALYQIEVNEEITRRFATPLINVNTKVIHPSHLVGYSPITQLGGFTTTFNYTCQNVNSSLSSNETTVTLSVSSSNDPPLVGAGLWALQFNGVDNFAITTENNTQISAIGTIEMWIKVTQCSSLQQQQVLIHGVYDLQNPDIGFILAVVCNSSNSYLQVQNVDNLSGFPWVLRSVNQSISLVLNTWMHIGVTFDDSTVTFYVNGARIGIGNIGTISLPRVFCLGAKYPNLANLATSPIVYPPTTGNFAGRMDEVRIWSIVYDTFQMSRLSVTKISPNTPGLQAYWDFNQGFGDGIVDLVHPPPPFPSSFYNLDFKSFTSQLPPKYYYYSSLARNFTNVLWLGAGINAFQPIFVVSDGPQFNSFVTLEDTPLQIQLWGSSLVSDLMTFVITQLPTYGTLYQVIDGQSYTSGQIMKPFLFWDTRTPLEQWPVKVIEFSSYLNLTANSSAYNPQNLLGPPKFYDSQNFEYKDDTDSWAPQWPCTNASAIDFVILQYSTPVYVIGVEIYENYNPGSVTQISSFDYTTRSWLPLYKSTPLVVTPPQYTIFSPQICEALFLSDLLRVEVSVCMFPGPPEISGIKLIGTTEVRSGVVLDRNHTVVYVPNPNFRSPPDDSFTYRAFDCPYRNTRASLNMLQNISVTPSNDPPFSVPLNFSTMENEFLMIRLRGVDVDGDSLTMIIQSLPSFGTLYQVAADESLEGQFTNPGIVSNPNGTVAYLPQPNECGLQFDSFLYSVSDRIITSNASLVTIDVYCIPGLHTVPEGIVYSFWVLAAILLVGCLLLLIVVIRFRKASDFRQSSPLLSCVMIVGAIIAIPSLYFFGTRLNVFYCHLRVWLIFVGYDLFLGTLLAKAFRIWRILAHRTLKRSGKLSDPYLLIIVGVVVALDTVGLLVYSFYGGSAVQEEVDKSNPAVTIQTCTYHPIILYTLLAYKGLILFFCVSLCFLIGSVSTTLPNFRPLAISIFTLTLSAILISPVFFLTTLLSPTALFLTAALFTTIPLAISLVVIFVPKIRRVTARRRVQSDIDFSLSSTTTATTTAKTTSKVASTSHSSRHKPKKVSRTNNTIKDSEEEEGQDTLKEHPENKTVIELMELLRTKDNEIEALRKKLRVKKEKIHKLRRQLADLKERFGNTLTIPPLSVEAQSHPTKTSSSHSEKSMSESQITHNNSNFSLQIVQSD